ncbi:MULTISPECIES: OmpH family outer membrane protein [Fusobacterium]|uniref:OmpH family outer membrane protein n=1 Tax=Fusobacterium TaxID=848 RepID=UPI0025BB428B|nr:OmpH family outer membrane protein [Fusobacterium sp.]MCI7223057.1 OmpH family outer membrane protein [Fusobacterium sp.]MDD7409903.1 OmpH family outer membrane protein [Fusobacteriaceae bacterium]MDY5712484.1 OmpH family outer membrane protein [Fusobacterium gastrosuis]
MKKILAVTAILMATSAFAEKIGVIDTQAVIANFSETKKAQQSLETQAKKLENEARQKEVNLEKEYVALQAKGDKLTDAEKKAFEKRTQEFQGFLQNAQSKLGKDEFDKMSKINTTLLKAVDKVAKEGKYEYVVEAGAVLYGGEDISEKVLKAMETLK